MSGTIAGKKMSRTKKTEEDDTWFKTVGGVGCLEIDNCTVKSHDGWTIDYTLERNPPTHTKQEELKKVTDPKLDITNSVVLKEKTTLLGPKLDITNSVVLNEKTTLLGPTKMEIGVPSTKENLKLGLHRCSTTIIALKCKDTIFASADGRSTLVKANEIVESDAKKLFNIEGRYLGAASGTWYYCEILLEMVRKFVRRGYSFFKVCNLTQQYADDWSHKESRKNGRVIYYPGRLTLMGFPNRWSRSRVEPLGTEREVDLKRRVSVYARGSGGPIAMKKLKELLDDRKVNLESKDIKRALRIAFVQAGIECIYTGGRIYEACVSRDTEPRFGRERPHLASLLEELYEKVDVPVKGYLLQTTGGLNAEEVQETKKRWEDKPDVKSARILGRVGQKIYWILSISSSNVPVPPKDDLLMSKILELNKETLNMIKGNFSSHSLDEW